MYNLPFHIKFTMWTVRFDTSVGYFLGTLEKFNTSMEIKGH